MLGNLTIALFIVSAELACCSVLVLLFHARLHRWMMNLRHRHAGAEHEGEAPAEIDLKQVAEALVDSRTKLQTALATPGMPAGMQQILHGELEQIGHFSRHVVDGHTFDGEACRLALAGVHDLLKLIETGGTATANAEAQGPAPQTIEDKMAALRAVVESGKPVLLQGATSAPNATGLSSDDAIGKLADQLLAAQKKHEPSPAPAPAEEPAAE